MTDPEARDTLTQPDHPRRVAAGYRSVRLQALPTMSIVVTSEGPCDRLGAVVEALHSQGRATGREIELIVVRAADCPGIESLETRHAGVRFVLAPGNATASQLRSAGVAAADGDVIVLADDARMPPPDWLSRVGHGTTRAPAARLRQPRPSPNGSRSPALPVPS